jgi:dipeptidyl aminopeptidase/acylaminoacyl peptidase
VTGLTSRAVANMKRPLLFLAAVGMNFVAAASQPFTVVDEIGLTLFDPGDGGVTSAVQFSPDGNYFAVWSERGRLDLNRVEDSLRVYRCQDVEAFLKRPNSSQPPSPVWVVERSDREGSVISHWRWLPDSSGVTFLDGGRAFDPDRRLAMADLRKKEIGQLTSTTEAVGIFDVRDREHYVYTAFDRVEWDTLRQKKRQADAQATAVVVGSEHSLMQLLLSNDPRVDFLSWPPKYLWVVIDGKRFEIKQDGVPVTPASDSFGNSDLALSPDGSFLATELPVHEVPSSWETLYPPPSESATYPYRIRKGSDEPPHQYVRINLKTGSIQSLTDAPLALDAGWGGAYFLRPVWSSDGHAVLLPGTFVRSKDKAPSIPCIAVVDLTSGRRDCVEMLGRHNDDPHYHYVVGATFAGGDKDRVMLSTLQNGLMHTIKYRRTSDGVWQLSSPSTNELSQDEHDTLKVVVREGLDEPPVLVAQDKQGSRVLWDPNPQLKNIELGHASVYTWRDKEGREAKGGLYKPADYQPGQHYPLVIQTHGFHETQFIPSGFLTSGSAARALAAAEILVLQVRESCPLYTPSETPCAASTYESAVHRLVAEGLVDPERIGIVGFSRTGQYVMEALTASPLLFKAALITDSRVGTYLEYVMAEEAIGATRQIDAMIGASPFGEGLRLWLQRAPGFHLDKLSAPLLIVPHGRSALLEMLEPYAGLHHLHRPVELMMLNTAEHAVSNPAMRIASQGGSVDWFRFWLQGYERKDLNPGSGETAQSLADQYRRWEKLCDLQVEQNPTQPAFCVRSRTH